MKKTTKASKAIKAIDRCQILFQLKEFNPVVVSTILVGLDTNDSDIDIICSYNSQLTFFDELKKTSANHNGICQKRNNYVIAQFQYASFMFEIYGSNLKIEEQMAFRHYQIMKRLCRIGGLHFKNAVKAIKKDGIKTEPAIASILRLTGNPYDSVLSLEQLQDTEIEELLLYCQI